MLHSHNTPKIHINIGIYVPFRDFSFPQVVNMADCRERNVHHRAISYIENAFGSAK